MKIILKFVWHWVLFIIGISAIGYDYSRGGWYYLLMIIAIIFTIGEFSKLKEMFEQ